jgi:hypothetical protein
VVKLINICLSHKETYGIDEGGGWIQKWWNIVAADLEQYRKKPYSQKACRDNINKQIARRRSEIQGLSTGEELTSGEWALAIDAWIDVVDQYDQKQKAAKERSAQNEAQTKRLRAIRGNMKRRLGEKDNLEENDSDDCDAFGEERINTQLQVENDPDPAADESQVDDSPAFENDAHDRDESVPRHRDESVSRPNSRISTVSTVGTDSTSRSRPRRAKKPRRGDTLEQAMIKNCKDMADSYKQLVSAVVRQSERGLQASTTSAETLEELKEIRQRQQAQEQKLDQQADKMDEQADKLDEQAEKLDWQSDKLNQQGERLDQLLSLVQGLSRMNNS